MVVIQCGLKLSTWCAGSGGSQRCRLRLATACVLPGATWHKLQIDLQMASICTGLRGARQGQAVN